ncbi:conjugative transfer system coupling protein TraD [Ferrimonas kyonanensis]|uniref:conjugative transfer system coupling protein TraD n=1 Tax=Ferrimonas kyonanensis TaxID=364763 RepID=UPI0003F5FEF0|nr:conjugative transfer system coupling protein TraD [Ferrimonas kyonanensis]
MFKQQPHYSDKLFEPAFSIDSAIVSSVCLALLHNNLDVGGMTPSTVAVSILCALAGKSLLQGVPQVYRQSELVRAPLHKVTRKQLRKYNAPRDPENVTDEDDIFLGEAFEWSTEVARAATLMVQRCAKISDLQTPILKPLFWYWERLGRRMGGDTWINGLDKSSRLMINNATSFGHTLITGAVGMGKTTMQRILSLGRLHLGDTVIIVDPKNDGDWRREVETECKILGKPFHYFAPAEASKSVRIDLLANWNRHTEIPDRISSLMATDIGGNPFVDFAYKVINQVVTAQLYCGIKPNLRNIGRALTMDKNKLCLRTIRKVFEEWYGPDWKGVLGDKVHHSGKYRLSSHIDAYSERATTMGISDAADGMIEICTHDGTHMGKMTSSLLPLFSTLNAGALGDLLSPDDLNKPDDHREIISLRDQLETGGALYLALDSLSDVKTAGYISKLICSDMCACAADRFNHDLQNAGNVSLFVDEVHAALEGNEAIISLAAMGRAAKFLLFLCTQNVADIVSKCGEATAKRILGLTNNYLSFRSTDPDTKQYCSDQFSTAYIPQYSTREGHSSGEGGSLLDFGDDYAETKSMNKDVALEPGLVGRLPKFEFFGRLADGRLLKGKIPIVVGA